MHAAVGQKAVQMKLLAFCFRAANCAHERFVLEEVSFANRFGNPGKVLIYNPAGADVQMANFRVTHLSFW
ncbi:hypothetical protein D3C76_1805800 [compost metagenome]